MLKAILKNILVGMCVASSFVVYAATENDHTYTEDKTSISVSVKDPVFVLKLKSNPSTGYTWFLREYDSAIITPVKHEYVQPNKGLIGAPGFENWTFKVKPAGFTVPQQTTIRMVYTRPWQSNDSGTQLVFRITTQGK